MAGSTNFQQFNPTGANQETDSQYTSDVTRTGGAGTGSVFASALANKLFYQVTTFVTAFCAMLAAKGYTTSDASLTQLETVLAGVLTAADQKPGLQVVSYSASPVFDASKANGFEIVLSGNVTAAQLKNLSPGQIVTMILVQDNSGGRSFAWQTSVGGSAQPDGTANAVSIQALVGRSDGSAHALTPMSVS